MFHHHPKVSSRTVKKENPASQQAGGDLNQHLVTLTLNEQVTNILPAENGSQASEKGNLYNLYEEKVRPCIDLIDSLRTLGVEQDLALPAIAVIGDQSSGKSSVLEALSGIALPRGSGIVTRCPLVLKLRRQPCEAKWRGKISFESTEHQLHDPAMVEQVIHKAQNLIAGQGVGISHKLITLEITSPDVPDLTLIDLPGITRVAVGNQPQDIEMQVKALIKKYIQRQQTINLVVVPCNVDIATTEALKMAKEVDPEGDRTIGILTKPDLVDKGAEKCILDVVRNHTYFLKKGYMIVKCRGQQEITNRLSLAEATKREMNFFQGHPNFRVLLDEGKATVPHLAEKLTSELIAHINKSLPLLEKQIKDLHQGATEELRQYGTDIPSVETDKMFFLIEKIKEFNQNIDKLLEGEEVVKDNESRLYNKIRTEFRNWELVLSANTQKVRNIIHEEVSKYDKQYRGKELLGFVNYKTFETIVQQYIQQLIEPALDTLQNVIEIVCQAFTDLAKSNFREFPNLHQTAQKLIETVKVQQAQSAENVIQLQFRMEQLVFCQDRIYSTVLKKARVEMFQLLDGQPQQLHLRKPDPVGISAKDSPTSSNSSITEIGVHLNAYFMETSARLGNQIPIIIQFFLLQENGNCLQKSMMHILQEKEHYSWILEEQRETSDKRRFLKERIFRLTQARRTLSQFSI